MSTRRIATALAALTFLALALAPTAAAHASKTSDDGKVRVTWGFLDEPAYTGSKLRIDLIIRDAATGAGIGGLTGADITELSLRYGEEEYDLGDVTAYRSVKGSAFGGDGNYTGEHAVWLTHPGIYTLHIEGNIAGSAIDLDIPSAHEYPAHDEIAFPEAADASGLEARVAALEQQVAALRAQQQTQAQTPATLTPQTPPTSTDAPAGGILLAAVGAVVAALLVRRK